MLDVEEMSLFSQHSTDTVSLPQDYQPLRPAHFNVNAHHPREGQRQHVR